MGQGFRRLLLAAVIAGMVTGLGFVLDRRGVGLRALPACALAAASAAPRFGPAAEAELPWHGQEPVLLKTLRLRHRADRLVAAFFVGHAGADADSIHNARVAARDLAGTVLEPGSVWSFNAALGPYDSRRGYRSGESYVGGQVVDSDGGGVCRLSSALYNLALAAGIAVVERHPHSMPVAYLPPGRDAAVSYGGKNLRLRNDGYEDLVLWADADDAGVYAAVYGRRQPPRVVWGREVLARQPHPTRRRSNPQLAAGATRVLVEGADGVTVRTWVERLHPDGRRERVDLGVDRYWPLPRIVEVGPGG